VHVASGVYAVPQSVVEGLNGVICDAGEALVIDTGNDAQDGRRLREFVDTLRPRRIIVVFTHGHSDHVLGSESFLDATVITTKHTADQIDRSADAWALERGLQVADFRPSISWPSVLLLADAALRIGRRPVELLVVPGHTAGSLVAWLPDLGILFGGDTVVTVIPPSIADGHNRDLESSLLRLAGLGARFLVPGHGRVVRGAEVIREGLLSTASYIAAVRAATKALLRDGHTPSAVLDAVSTSSFAHLSRLDDRHDIPGRHRDLVRGVVRDEIARLDRDASPSAEV
jgi:cyclase